MSEPFIAPEGAMQFEVTKGWDGGEVPEKFRPFIMWVLPQVGRPYWKVKKPDCPHENGFIVLRHNREEFTGKPSSSFGVCECVGRLIE